MPMRNNEPEHLPIPTRLVSLNRTDPSQTRRFAEAAYNLGNWKWSYRR